MTTNKTLWIGNNKTHVFEELLTPLYDNVSKEIFDDTISLPISFKPFVDLIYNFHKQKYTKWNNIELPEIEFKNKNNTNNKVLLAFSGGLDSIGQALVLRDQGYHVICFHIENLNFYENGQATKVCKSFIQKTGLEYVSYQCKKNKQVKQFWPENPMKNQMAFALMLDYCIEHGINLISAGDALSSKLETRTLGVNLTDCDQMTILFFNAIKNYVNIDFLPATTYKYERLQKIIENNLLDCYYPCVNAGRFNQCFHKKFEEKFNIKIPKYLCGYCRKCSNSLLLLHYMKYLQLPDNVLDLCWKKMNPVNPNQNIAEYKYGLSIPLEIRIQNLFKDMV